MCFVPEVPALKAAKKIPSLYGVLLTCISAGLAVNTPCTTCHGCKPGTKQAQAKKAVWDKYFYSYKAFASAIQCP